MKLVEYTRCLRRLADKLGPDEDLAELAAHVAALVNSDGDDSETTDEPARSMEAVTIMDEISDLAWELRGVSATSRKFYSYPTVEQWIVEHSTPLHKRFRAGLHKWDGQADQIVMMLRMAACLGVDVRFPSTHVSNEVVLPVAAYLLAPDVVAFVRDNFVHDLNVAVQSARPLGLKCAQMYPEVSRDWYEEQKARAKNYRGADACGYDFNSLNWYSQWARGKLIEEDGKLYRADHCFLEGIWKGTAYEDTEAGARERELVAAECEEKYGITATFDEVGKYPLTGFDGEPGYSPGKLVWTVAVRDFDRAQELLATIKQAAEVSS